MEIDTRPMNLRPEDLSDTLATIHDQRRERGRELVFHRGASPRGPRPDSVSSEHVPTLVQGRDALPATCTACGSRFLAVEPPLGRDRHGTVTCNLCSRVLCWLAAPLVPLRAVPIIAPVPPRAAVQSDQPRRVISARFRWVDGCGRACSVLYGHDPSTHELFGRQSALAEIAQHDVRPRGQRQSGPLLVDFDASRVWVSGAELALTPNELGIVLCLMSRAGELVTHREVVETVWDAAQADMWETRPTRHGQWHPLRVNICRVRGKFGAVRHLLQTINHVGYRLLVEPPTSLEAR